MSSLLRKNQTSKKVPVWILLPIDEVILGFDTQRITGHERATVWGGTQADDLRRECNQAIVVVNRLVVEHHSNSHTRPKKEKTSRNVIALSSGTSSFQLYRYNRVPKNFSRLQRIRCQRRILKLDKSSL